MDWRSLLDWLSNNQRTLTRIEAKLDRLTVALDAAFLQEKKHMAAMDDAIEQLTDQVAANTTVIGSAKVMISGFNQKLADAVAAAQAAGATPAQLKALNDLSAAVKQNDEELAQAIVENTPVAQ